MLSDSLPEWDPAFGCLTLNLTARSLPDPDVLDEEIAENRESALGAFR